MAQLIRGKHDPNVDKIIEALTEYEKQNRGSKADVYRQNPGAIRVRVIDDRFVNTSRSYRHDELWEFLQRQVKDDDVMSEISWLIVVPSSELQSSRANLEFEDPVPSSL